MLEKIRFPESRWQWRVLFLGYVLVIAAVSLAPSESRSLPIEHIDKVGHFLAYVVMAILALVSFKGGWGRIAAVLLTLIVAILLEWGQGFVPGRLATVADGISNVLGLIVGVVVFVIFSRRWKESTEKKSTTN